MSRFSTFLAPRARLRRARPRRRRPRRRSSTRWWRRRFSCTRRATSSAPSTRTRPRCAFSPTTPACDRTSARPTSSSASTTRRSSSTARRYASIRRIRRFASTSRWPTTRRRGFRTRSRRSRRCSRPVPSNAPAVLLLATRCCRAESSSRSSTCSRRARRSSRNDLAFGYVLGTALLRTGQRERAQVYLDRIFKAGESAEAHLLMGTALIETRDYPGAVVELRKALALNPDLPTLRTVYARALLGAGEHESAVRELQRALLASPNDFDANLQLGALLRRDDRHEESVRLSPARASSCARRTRRRASASAGALLSLGETRGVATAAGRRSSPKCRTTPKRT